MNSCLILRLYFYNNDMLEYQSDIDLLNIYQQFIKLEKLQRF